MCPERPCALSMEEFPAACTAISRYPFLLLCSTREVLELWLQGPWQGQQAQLGAEWCSCCCFYSLAFLASPGITHSFLDPRAFPWCCSGSEGGGGKPVALLQIVVNQKSALCERSWISRTVILLLGTGRKNVSSVVHVGWIIAVCCLWAERIEGLWAWD